MGTVCGIISGGASIAASAMVKFQRTTPYLKDNDWVKIGYCVAVACITVLLLSAFPLFVKNCRPNPLLENCRRLLGTAAEACRRKLGSAGGDRKYVQYNCPAGEYNELASLTLVGEEVCMYI